MNIYLVERTDDWDYDDYDQFVCFANSEEEARWQVPDPEYHMWKDKVYCYSYGKQEPVGHATNWVEDPNTLKVFHIGVSLREVKPDVILASFNAG